MMSIVTFTFDHYKACQSGLREVSAVSKISSIILHLLYFDETFINSYILIYIFLIFSSHQDMWYFQR